MKSYCGICKRELDNESDPLSDDCGGDCWGCIGEMEADSDYEPSLEQVRKEYKQGLRPNWLPAPQTEYNIDGSLDEGSNIELKINLLRPLGEPWPEEEIELTVFFDEFKNKKQITFIKKMLKTNNTGSINYKFQQLPINKKGEIWYQIKRKENSWSYPIRE